jgi:hypothetical protein
LPKAVFHVTAVLGNGMAQTIMNMLHVNKQGIRSLKSEEMKKLMGSAGIGNGCTSGACAFQGSYCQIVQGTCGGSAGDCYCTGGSGYKVEMSAGCSSTLNGPMALCYENTNHVANADF